MAEQRISIGNVGMSSQGEWSASHTYTDIDGNVIKGYETGDTVTANNSIYESLVDGNTAALTDTTKWRCDVDGSKVAASIDSANKAAKAANDAATNANDTGDHPTYVGKDNYVYKWNKISKTYDKTDIFVKGDKGDKGDKGETGATGGALWPHFKKVNNHLYAVDNGSNLGQRIKRVNNHLVAIL